MGIFVVGSVVELLTLVTFSVDFVLTVVAPVVNILFGAKIPVFHFLRSLTKLLNYVSRNVVRFIIYENVC